MCEIPPCDPNFWWSNSINDWMYGDHLLNDAEIQRDKLWHEMLNDSSEKVKMQNRRSFSLPNVRRDLWDICLSPKIPVLSRRSWSRPSCWDRKRKNSDSSGESPSELSVWNKRSQPRGICHRTGFLSAMPSPLQNNLTHFSRKAESLLIANPHEIVPPEKLWSHS
jgi:hypothetical protein